MKKTNDDNFTFTVDYNILLQVGLTINQYFFLQLSNTQNVNLYRFYVEQFPQPVNKNDIIQLIEKGLLDTKDGSDRFTFENLKVTAVFKQLFEKKIENAIEELQSTYPTKTPAKKRRLQSDPDKWKPKYLSIVRGKPELHNKILNCIKAELKHRRATGSEEFWPLLTTYINNRRWEDYMDETDVVMEEVSKDYDI